jgi:hypothetical protein
MNMPIDIKTRAIISATDRHILLYKYDEAVKKADLSENMVRVQDTK